MSELLVGIDKTKLFAVCCFGFAMLIGVYFWHVSNPERAVWLSRIFQREYLRPGRLPATAFLATASVLVVTWLRERLDHRAARFFVMLGRYSLFCYTVHLPIVVFFDSLAPRWQGLGLLSMALNLVAQLVVLAAVWGLARARETIVPLRSLLPMRYIP